MLKKSLTDSWSFFKNHVIAISVIILPIVAPVEIFSALYQYYIAGEEFLFSEQIIPMLIEFIAYPIYSVGIVFYIASKIYGEKIDTKSLWQLGVKFWVPYAILNVLIGLAVMFGFFLFIIPGVIFAIRYAFSEFDLLLNKSKPLDAMRNSWESTKEYMWVLLGGFSVITIVLFVPYYFFISLVDESSMYYSVLDTSLNIAYSVLGIWYTIFSFRVYEFAKLQPNH